ncbi:MAG: hypothetical protein R2818_13400 [Flavobacteriales bacterium]
MSENRSECVKRNIRVHVDRINADQSVAFCSVEQRLTGLLRRTCSVPELIWRAEQALAPLHSMGIVPLLTVRHKTLKAAPMVDRPKRAISPMDWLPDLWRWLGSPFARERFGAVAVVRDPFGWKRAMYSSLLK